MRYPLETWCMQELVREHQSLHESNVHFPAHLWVTTGTLQSFRDSICGAIVLESMKEPTGSKNQKKAKQKAKKRPSIHVQHEYNPDFS